MVNDTHDGATTPGDIQPMRPPEATLGVAAMDKPKILLVCTGNICRSPAAEVLLTEHLGSTATISSIGSAGIRAVPGTPMDPTMQALLGRRSIEAAQSSARKVDVRMLESADLVLTASTSHRAAVARMLPAALHKTLTLKQLARYAPFIHESGQAPAGLHDRIRWILATVPRARARARLDDDSIADPLGKSRRHYRAAIDELDRACATVASLLDAAATTPLDTSRSWWSEMSSPGGN